MERRHIPLSTHRTTISLEPDYWQAIEILSAGNWRQWASDTLATKPGGMGRSSWIRCQVLAGVRKSSDIPPIYLGLGDK